MSVSCELCVLSGRRLGPIPRPEVYYPVWCVWVWSCNSVRGGHDLESGQSATNKIDVFTIPSNMNPVFVLLIRNHHKKLYIGEFLFCINISGFVIPSDINP